GGVALPAISVPNLGARWNHDSAVRLCWGVRQRSGVTRVRLTKERCQHHRHERVLKLTRGRRNRCERLPSDSWWDLRVQRFGLQLQTPRVPSRGLSETRPALYSRGL